jgi:hypothetical protein
MTETISFDLCLHASYWDRPPAALICINGTTKYQGLVTATADDPITVSFKHTLEFGQPHKLEIRRYNKSPNQCLVMADGSLLDQLLFIDSVTIDGIDIRDTIWSRSTFCPVYPEPWKSQQIKAGVTIEEIVIGETTLGLIGLWTLDFTSPFWQFLLDTVNT